MVDDAGGDGRYAAREVATPWGKCTEELRLLVPEELFLSMRKKAASMGMTPTEYQRWVLFIGHYGLEETKDRFAAMLDGIGVVREDSGSGGEG